MTSWSKGLECRRPGFAAPPHLLAYSTTLLRGVGCDWEWRWDHQPFPLEAEHHNSSEQWETLWTVFLLALALACGSVRTGGLSADAQFAGRSSFRSVTTPSPRRLLPQFSRTRLSCFI